jgi:hypothetical protein
MKKGENIVVIIDGDVRGATVIDILPNGDVLISKTDHDGNYAAFPRGKVFTASEWEQIKGEFV